MPLIFVSEPIVAEYSVITPTGAVGGEEGLY